jgi:KDO2-lipid IV(A) lauroyltransferase
MGRRDVVRKNIETSLGSAIGKKGTRRLSRKVYAHFGQVLFEIPHILRLNAHNLHRYVVFENPEYMETALNKGKGVFAITAHFGNWELMCAAVSLYFGELAVIARPVDFQPADRLINDLRGKFGTVIIDKQRAMRKILESIRTKKIVGILMDQNVDWYEGVFVNFLGRWACTNKGPAAMALKTGSPVVPCFTVRQRDGRFRLIFEEEIPVVRTGEKNRDVEENTILFTRALEKYILKYPDQWFWFHKRWKTLPYCAIPDERQSGMNRDAC